MRTTFLLAALLATPLLSQAADDASGCHYTRVADLPIRYVSRGLLPAVDGELNNTPATMVLHSSSDQTHVTMTGVLKHDLGLHYTGKKAVGIGGISRVYGTHVKEIAIGPIRRDKQTEFSVMGDTSFAPEYDVVVGASFLMTFDLMLDLRAKQLQMFRAQGCDKTDLRLWQEDRVVVPLNGHTPTNPNPHFTVLVNGKKLDAVFAIGARRSYMTLDGAERAGIDVKGPDAVRLADVGGVGSERAPQWSVPIKTFQIGDETVKDASLGVIETKGDLSAELYLGQDFLRAHRVLVSTSQDKLYLSYLGGDVFTRGTGIEPWVQQEAEAGNPHAQYALGHIYNNGLGVPRSATQARPWMEKAAAQGQPNALLYVGRRDLLAGKAADAIPKLRAALDQLPSDKLAPLWLYNARVRNGEADLARTELEATVKKQDNEDWPYAVAQFYLGKWNEAKVLDEAGDDKKYAQNRTCQAENLMAEWHAARGDQDQAKSLMDNVRAHCVAPR